MIFTCNFVTHENHLQITSLMTKTSLFMITPALFYISSKTECYSIPQTNYQSITDIVCDKSISGLWILIMEGQWHWKPRVVIMPTLPSLAAPQVVETCGATSDDEVGIKITLGFQWRCQRCSLILWLGKVCWEMTFRVWALPMAFRARPFQVHLKPGETSLCWLSPSLIS